MQEAKLGFQSRRDASRRWKRGMHEACVENSFASLSHASMLRFRLNVSLFECGDISQNDLVMPTDGVTPAVEDPKIREQLFASSGETSV